MIKKTYCIHLFLLLTTISCNNSQKPSSTDHVSVDNNDLDYQGHRGSRGLFPENTIIGFENALKLGVNTLEMDVVITKDKKVILSHEPWFSHEIALTPEGEELDEKSEKSHRIYAMSYEETQRYDVGLKDHPRFPDQKKVKATKPLLEEVISASEKFCKDFSRALPLYNIETKTTLEGDGIFHPEPEEFVELLVNIIKDAQIAERTTIQSFDIRTLQVAKEKYPELKLALLVENKKSPEENLKSLGFTPDIYSPDYALVNNELISFAKVKNMAVIPWTVNDTAEMQRLVSLGVDGIITDYPNRIPSQH